MLLCFVAPWQLQRLRSHANGTWDESEPEPEPWLDGEFGDFGGGGGVRCAAPGGRPESAARAGTLDMSALSSGAEFTEDESAEDEDAARLRQSRPSSCFISSDSSLGPDLTV